MVQTLYDEKFLIGVFRLQSLDDRPTASFRGGYIALFYELVSCALP